MMLTATLWANKFASIFHSNKKDSPAVEDMGVFELCLVHLGIKSIASSASSTGLCIPYLYASHSFSFLNAPPAGMMLEIKGLAPLRSSAGCTLASCALIPSHTMPQSVQESTLFYEKFLSGLFVSNENRKHLNQVPTLSSSYDDQRCSPFS